MKDHYQTSLGIELGSTRIKAVLLDDMYRVVSSGGSIWKSRYENGIWTYPLEEAWAGLCSTLEKMHSLERVSVIGVSGMMHGYLAFDADWNLLVPFRTWQNTVTAEAAEQLTELFGFNIPQRWSIAHLYQAMLHKEPHVSRIAHITTLAGYVHYKLTGVNSVGVGEASGMFPIDSSTLEYDARMLAAFDVLAADMPWRIRDILPVVLKAGEPAGFLTDAGAACLQNRLRKGVPFAPPEGDAGTGMVATNAVAPRTGNVSAGTSIFAMVVLEQPLSRHYPEIDLVTTPDGAPVAMVHCNNCTGDINAWTSVLRESVAMFGTAPSTDALYESLFLKSLEGDPDCSGIVVYNNLAGEGVTHLDAGRPMVVRMPDSRFTLANLLRAQIYTTISTLKLGMELLHTEGVAVDSLTGHGGLFKTAGVAQRYLAAACGAPVSCMETAGEGGPYGMALLAAYLLEHREGETLRAFLSERVYTDTDTQLYAPDPATVAGFASYYKRYVDGLPVEEKAIQVFQEG